MGYLCLFLSMCQSRLQSGFVLPLLSSTLPASACLFCLCSASTLGSARKFRAESTPHGFARSKWLRGVKIRCKTTYFNHFDHYLQFISDIRRITSHFILEAAMRKLLCLQRFSLSWTKRAKK